MLSTYQALCFLFERSTNQVSIIVCLLFVALETMAVMVLLLLVTCITLDISRLFVIQNGPPSLCMMGLLLRYGLKVWVLLKGLPFTHMNWKLQLLYFLYIYGYFIFIIYLLIFWFFFFFWNSYPISNFVVGITISPFYLRRRFAFRLVTGLWHYCWCNVWVLISW